MTNSFYTQIILFAGLWILMRGSVARVGAGIMTFAGALTYHGKMLYRLGK